MDYLSDKNRNPEIQAKIADIGYLSPHGEALMEIAKAELAFIYEHLKSYSQNEQIFILDYMSSEMNWRITEIEDGL